ncbi:hypothetical protein [Streptomyces canus]|uniref:hypothetical protein n=1 Tax=Streptomyces canus TaxID=58343 RepID=UPI00278138F2|nr:hypothetical protein [Streptomyces canus]MDQ1067235.1 hypothetical protein [Streptomyces canus]
MTATADKGRPLPLWYTLPEGFRPVELSADPEERLEAHYTALAELCPDATTGQLVASALGFEAALGRLVEDGLVHFSSFVLRTDDDLLLTGICQISVTDRPAGDPHLYPHSALRAHPDQPDTHKGVVELPSGLAAVVVADQAVTVPGALFGVEGESTSAVRTATFHLAFPRIPQAVVVSLSTEVFEAQEEFLELATLMAAGISFTAPKPDPVPKSAPVAASPFG